jgi:hypothetical protein
VKYPKITKAYCRNSRLECKMVAMQGLEPRTLRI